MIIHFQFQCARMTFQLAVALVHSYLCLIRSSHQRCSVRKKVFLEILQNSQENTCARGSFLITLQAWSCNFISGTGVLLWILRNFKQHIFYRTPPGDCFCLIENVLHSPENETAMLNFFGLQSVLFSKLKCSFTEMGTECQVRADAVWLLVTRQVIPLGLLS